MGAISERAAASCCHSPSGCMQWDSEYETYTHTGRCWQPAVSDEASEVDFYAYRNIGPGTAGDCD